MHSKFFFTTLISVFAMSTATFADEIIVKTPSGSTVTIEFQSDESFADVMRKIDQQVNLVDDTAHTQNSNSYYYDYSLSAPGFLRSSTVIRDYSKTVTESEKEDLKYVITTLATASWPTLLAKKSSLNKAGDRIDHLHPLRFLRTIFTNEELNSCLHVIRDRSKVWSEFFSGLSGTLEQEANKDNMSLEIVKDFAKSVKVELKHIQKHIENREWKDFIEALLNEIPRGGEPDRYDI